MREVFYRDHGEQSWIHFKRSKCVNHERGSCVSAESNWHSFAFAGKETVCGVRWFRDAESQVRYWRAKAHVVEGREAELCCRDVALECKRRDLQRTNGWNDSNGFYSGRVFFFPFPS